MIAALILTQSLYFQRPCLSLTYAVGHRLRPHKRTINPKVKETVMSNPNNLSKLSDSEKAIANKVGPEEKKDTAVSAPGKTDGKAEKSETQSEGGKS